MDSSNSQHLIKKAVQLQQLGKIEDAKALYEKVLAEDPRHLDAIHLYGLACHQLGEHSTAVRYIQHAVDRVPNQPVLRNNLGDALRKAGKVEAAVEQFVAALKLRPGYAGAHLNLGSAYLDLADYESALAQAREAVRLEPQWAEAWFNLGLIQLDHVLLEDAADSFRHALAINPKYARAASSLLYTLNLLPDAVPEAVAEEHRQVTEALFDHLVAAPTSTHPRLRTRIGFVSGDFCTHAVNHFFEPLLKHLDSSHFEIFCYSDVEKSDAATQRLKQYAEHWRDITGWSDETVCEQIRSDRIEILFDMAGYTTHCRLGVFARRPAPKQMTWIGYPNTTGLSSMDYRVVDEVTAPPDEEPLGTEMLLRIPRGFACFQPPANAPQVSSAPFLEKDIVTLGSLHKLEKVNQRAIEAWARILGENPGTRLLMARDNLDDWHRQRLRRAFQAHGIGAERLDLKHLNDPGKSFLELFSEMDLLLDSFPWSGHTIACMSLWMGVPVVSLYGNSHAGRMVASVLDAIGLNHLIAHDLDSYARITAELCSTPAELARLRAELRDRMEKSPVCDQQGFARSFETACASIPDT